ncbi:YdcH family protein [Acinetobacter celticus]|uniref:DUF465 domain-containing protein n=1 Tax=Acinetobacter celticus TaxID=1891224 RepID=A0A1C3D0W8_9GAMM|nr:DUF465 domain-containing protein [Acinetobacter celticus]ODA14449.1 hypothetical protein BBP83_01155 [Acinetobacter celticus]
MKTKECNKKIKNMFPEFKDLIQQLLEHNPRFAHLFERHAELDQEICQLEQCPVNQINIDIETLKRKKLKLKDEIYRLLKQNQNDEYAF